MKVKNTKANLNKCICGSCPTYDKCMKKGMEGLFCARGKTGCNTDKNGCICGKCPIAKDNKLSGGYFCFKGAAK